MLGASQDIPARSDDGPEFELFARPCRPLHEDVFVHPLAHVENSHIGSGTKIWQFASVIRNSIIGSGCNIATCAIVDGAHVGDGTTVGHGAFINPGIRIGRNVFIGPHVSLCNDYWPRVSKEGWFDIDDLMKGLIVVTRIGDEASIGANVVVMPGVRIGQGVMIAASSTVDRDVPDGHLFHRDGTMTPIDPARVPRRMRTLAA